MWAHEAITVRSGNGATYNGQKLVYARGLDGNPNADELEVLAEAIAQGVTTGATIFKRINYAENLVARRRATPAGPATPETHANAIAATWATERPQEFTEAVQAEALQAGINQYFRAMVKVNNGVVPAPQQVGTLMKNLFA